MRASHSNSPPVSSTDAGTTAPAGDRSTIEQTISDLKQAKNGEDVARIRQLTEKLQQATYAVGQQMYAQQQAAQGGPGSAPAGDQPQQDWDRSQQRPSGDEFVEGEFREV